MSTNKNQDATLSSDQAKSCCPPGSTGPAVVTSDAPLKGQMMEIPSPAELPDMSPMPIYVTGTPLNEANRIVVVFTDVFGIDAGHHKVFADCVAQRLNLSDKNIKTTAVIPDLFRGQPILRPWIDNPQHSKLLDGFGALPGFPAMVYRIKKDYPPAKVEQEVFHLVVPWLQQQAPLAKSLACIGFCFGGWVVGRTLGTYAPPITDDKSTNDTSKNPDSKSNLEFQCGIGIHPSFQPALAHGELQTTLASRIWRPMLLLPAWNDDLQPNSKAVQLMAGSRRRFTGVSDTATEPDITNENDPKHQVCIPFDSMLHGWVSRGDLRDPKIVQEQERALELAVNFIQHHTNATAS